MFVPWITNQANVRVSVRGRRPIGGVGVDVGGGGGGSGGGGGGVGVM